MEVPEETLILKIKSMGRSVILAIHELLKPCVDLGSCACVHPFTKLWNSYKGGLNGPALIRKEKLERSNSKITLNHMSWLIKIMCCMSLKVVRKRNKHLGLYAPFLALKTHFREATFHSDTDTGAMLITTVLSQRSFGTKSNSVFIE